MKFLPFFFVKYQTHVIPNVGATYIWLTTYGGERVSKYSQIMLMDRQHLHILLPPDYHS